MEEELLKTPEQNQIASVRSADTVKIVKNAPAAQHARTLKDIINELNTTFFFSYRRFRLKREFLALLRDSDATGNVTLLQDFVLDALLKYISVDDRQEILGMERGARSESALLLPFAIAHRINNLEKIKLLVEKFKIPVKPEWVSLRSNAPEITIYLQKSTPLYTAVQKKDVKGFKIALKAKDVKLTEYAELNIVDLIQSKIRENQDRHPVVRYFLNRNWNRMLRATTGQIKKQLFAQAKQNSISEEWLALFNQCPLEEIYYALTWYDHNNARLYDKLKKLNLSEYSNIYSQVEYIASEEKRFGLTNQSRVPSNLKIVRKVGGSVVQDQDRPENIVYQNKLPVQQEPDARTRFHQHLRDGNNSEIASMLRLNLLSKSDVEEVLNSEVHYIDGNTKKALEAYLDKLENPTTSVRRTLF
ncbi:MAG: hypothetical protein SFW07_03540 [Gammaproteobacteria bacterium]|nr:hypothetical protein [Gammaproteobacteria bacterium]